MYCDLKVQCPE